MHKILYRELRKGVIASIKTGQDVFVAYRRGYVDCLFSNGLLSRRQFDALEKLFNAVPKERRK